MGLRNFGGKGKPFPQLTALITTVDGVSPDADALIVVVSKSGWALIAGGFSVPARVEHTAVVVVREDTVQTGAVRGGDRGLWRRGTDLRID